MSILGLILAGGQGRRMGGADKALLPLAGRPLVAHVAGRLAPQTAALAISANGDPARFAALALPVMRDADMTPAGPLAGILAGLDHAAASGLTHVLSVPTDTPLVPPDLAARLAAVIGQAGVATAASHGRQHHAVALWRTDAAPALRAALAQGERRLRVVAVSLGCTIADWGAAAPDPFFNVNTPADLATVQSLFAHPTNSTETG
jgi:molybdopterin-guanine dinucleotide biosynthesis protein A